MKIYLAHNFAARVWLVDKIPYLRNRGHECTSSWIVADSHTVPKNARENAEMDLADIDRADAFVLYTDQYGPTLGKGKFLELGYALAKGKRCYLLGSAESTSDKSSVFYALPQVQRISTLGEIPAEQ